jgi:hypothetical protein
VFETHPLVKMCIIAFCLAHCAAHIISLCSYHATNPLHICHDVSYSPRHDRSIYYDRCFVNHDIYSSPSDVSVLLLWELLPDRSRSGRSCLVTVSVSYSTGSFLLCCPWLGACLLEAEPSSSGTSSSICISQSPSSSVAMVPQTFWMQVPE